VTVHRLAKYCREDPFTRIPNDAISDLRLDIRALGLLVLMLSKPDGWTFREKNLADQGGVGKDALKTSMRKLIEAGYVVRERSARPDGPPIWVTKVYDRPIQPKVGLPDVGKPVSGKTRPLSNKGFVVTKEVSKRDTGTGNSRARKPIDPQWSASLELLQELNSKFPKVDVDRQVEPFVDYWLSRGDARADWNATFRTWCRNQDKWRREKQGVSEGGWR